MDTADTVDYFHFSLTAKRDVGVRIRRLDYNADLYIEDNDGTVIASSEETGDSKEVVNVTLAANDAGEHYYVRVEGKEDGTNDYQFRYFAEAPPNVSPSGLPTITGTAQVRETLTANTSVIADDNGLNNAVFAYQWVRTANGTDTDVSGATSGTFLLTPNELDHAISVRVSFTDDAGYAETVTSNATTTVVRPPNVSPNGLPTIRGTVAVGKTLTANTSGITDDNGLSGATFTYQWVKNTGGADADISGATGSTYTITATDAGSSLKVTVSFTDDAGYSESLTSSATTVLAAQGQASQNNAIQPRTDTVTQTAAGATWTLTGTQSPTAGQQYTYTITLASGTKPNNEYMGFYLTDSATNQTKLGLDPDDCTSPKEFCASFSGHISTSTGIWNNVQGHDTIYALLGTTSPHTVTATVQIASTTPADATIKFGAIKNNGLPRDGGMTLTVQAATDSTDATLSGLALENPDDSSAISLNETFASTTTSYTADVVNAVDEITIDPTVNESNATVEYLDSSDMALTDADGTEDDFQVALDVGENTIKVKVTAQDTSTTETYTPSW